jgi:hypothetical protein
MGHKMTLAQARDGFTHLDIFCASSIAAGEGCHHSGEMSLLHAITLWGEEARLDDLPLKCSRCGSRKVDVRPGRTTSPPRSSGRGPWMREP